MAGIPKVKIQFDADLDGLKKGTAIADKEVGGFADRVGEFGKKAAAAFAVAAAAAAAYAVKLAVDGVKAAIEDEQAQIKLASALEKATGATNAQIKAVEDQILKTSLATGVADDKLRPALQRLAVATGDTEEAQKLLNLALDISAATGKPLESVSNALGKAYEGNTTALVKLNAGISTAEAKTLGYTGAVQQLTDLYGGAAATNADTFQGRIDRVKVAFDETKESIGQALLPIVEKLLEFITEMVLPVFQKFSDALSGSGEGILGRFESIVNYIRDFVEPIFDAVRNAFVKVSDAFKEQKPRFDDILTIFKEIWQFVDQYLVPIFKTVLVKQIETFATQASIAIKVVVPVIEAVLNTVKSVINGIISVINTAINLYNKANNLFGGKDIANISKIGAGGVSGSNVVGAASLPSGVVIGGGVTGGGVTGGGVTGGGVTGGGVTGGGVTGGGVTGGGITGGGVTAGGNVIGTNSTPAKVELTEKNTKEIGDAWANSFLGQIGGIGDVGGVRFFEETGGQIRMPVAPSFDPARFRAGEEGNRSVINLTVNGAVDAESTARQIVTILNDSQARGTLGASGFAGSIAS
jgi:hypothetical protein